MNLKYLKFLYFSVIAAVAFYYFSNVTVMILLWVFALAVIRFYNFDNNLEKSEKQIFWLTAFIYPAISLLLKILIVENFIQYSWFWLNRLEHLFWSFALVILAMPIYTKIYRQKIWVSLLFMLGLVSLLGNLNEILEYFLRVDSSDYHLSLFYQDTIFDIVTNFFGGIIAFLIIRLFMSKAN